MEQLAEETLRCIFSYTTSPEALSKTCKALYYTSKDPYLRAQFFLLNHGPLHAFWAAFSRSGCLTEEVIDILISSGAHISRYLAQMVLQAYTRGRVEMCPKNWATHPKLRFTVFAHFLKVCSLRFPELDPNKNMDDGVTFRTWVLWKQSPSSGRDRIVTWELVKDLFINQGFIPFSPVDAILTTFPTALALDHRLLPLAKVNGLVFNQDARDNVFRTIFSTVGKETEDNQARAREIVEAVKEVTELDPELFVSKSVVGEVLLDVSIRPAAVEALKILGDEMRLRFDLDLGVQILLKTFRKTRTITSKGATIRKLFKHFHSDDPVVREVVLVTVALQGQKADKLLETLEELALLPITSEDVIRVAANAYTDKVMQTFLNNLAENNLIKMEGLISEMITRSIDVPSKGLFLNSLAKPIRARIRDIDRHGSNEDDEQDDPHEELKQMQNLIAYKVRRDYVLPVAEFESDDVRERRGEKPIVAKLAYDYETRSDPYKLCKIWNANDDDDEGGSAGDVAPESTDRANSPAEAQATDEGGRPDVVAAAAAQVAIGELAQPIETVGGPGPSTSAAIAAAIALSEEEGQGTFLQATLSDKIAENEREMRALAFRGRRGFWRDHVFTTGVQERLKYPIESLPVAVFVSDLFGPKHAITNIFLDHAIVNGNGVHLAFAFADGSLVTTRHFEMLMRLGRPVLAVMWQRIEFQPFVEEKIEPSVKRVAFSPPPIKKRKLRRSRLAMEVDSLADPLPASPAAAAPSLAVSRRPRRSIDKITYIDELADDEEEEEKKLAEGEEKPKPKEKARKSETSKVDVKGKGREVPPKDEEDVSSTAHFKTSMVALQKEYARQRLKWIRFVQRLGDEQEAELKQRKKEQRGKTPKGKRATPVQKNLFHKNLVTNLNRLIEFDISQREEGDLPKVQSYTALPSDSGSSSPEEEDEDDTISDVEAKDDEEYPAADDDEDDSVESVASTSKSTSRKRRPSATSSGSSSPSKAASGSPNKKPRANGTSVSLSPSKAKSMPMTKHKPKPKPMTRTSAVDRKGKGRAALEPEAEAEGEVGAEAKMTAAELLFGDGEESELSELDDEAADCGEVAETTTASADGGDATMSEEEAGTVAGPSGGAHASKKVDAALSSEL